MARGKSVRLLASIPERYAPDFMERLDKRTVLGRAVVDRFESIVADLGGEDALSTIRRSLVRRFTWFEVMIEGMECRAAAGEEIDIGSWTQLTNSWLGIARLLGLERRPRRAVGLSEYLAADGTAEAGAAAPGDDRPPEHATGAPNGNDGATGSGERPEL
jgi:hypothetical protein